MEWKNATQELAVSNGTESSGTSERMPWLEEIDGPHRYYLLGDHQYVEGGEDAGGDDGQNNAEEWFELVHDSQKPVPRTQDGAKRGLAIEEWREEVDNFPSSPLLPFEEFRRLWLQKCSSTELPTSGSGPPVSPETTKPVTRESDGAKGGSARRIPQRLLRSNQSGSADEIRRRLWSERDGVGKKLERAEGELRETLRVHNRRIEQERMEKRRRTRRDDSSPKRVHNLTKKSTTAQELGGKGALTTQQRLEKALESHNRRVREFRTSKAQCVGLKGKENSLPHPDKPLRGRVSFQTRRVPVQTCNASTKGKEPRVRKSLLPATSGLDDIDADIQQLLVKHNSKVSGSCK